MTKLKHLIAVSTLLAGAMTANAQTDVTSTYLTNADFSQTTASTAEKVYGYGKDGTPYGLQTVDGWTSVVTNGDNSNATYPNSGMAGVVVAYGSSTALQGGGKAAPAADPDGNSGNCLGFVGVWGCGGYYYQEVTLQPGAYTINIPVYNQSGTSATTTYFGWTPNEGTASTMATPTTTGSWTTLTTSFTLATATTGQIRVGYKSNGSGSGANPHLFIDKVQILCSPFATADDYAALNTAISTVEATAWGFDAGEYAPYNYADVIEALATAKAIDQTANNSQVTVQALTATLNTSMTANADEVNAIFDGSFQHDYSGQSGNVQPLGWYRVKGTAADGYNVRYVTSSGNAGLATVGGYGMFTKFAAYYGWADGYTLPLNASTYYTVSFKYGGWGDCKKDGFVTMTDPESASLSLISSNRLPLSSTDANSNTESWVDYSAIFKTNDAGNYVLGLRKDDESKQSQYVYGNFVLKTTTVAEATAYYNTVLAEVSPSYDESANGGSEKTAFKNAIDAAVPSTVAEIMEAAANLYTLRDAFVAATTKFDLYVAEKANAERIDASITASVTAPTTAAEADAAWKTILVNEYNFVKDNFNADAAEAYGITIDQWTGTATSGGNADTPQTRSNEKWGTAATTYYEQGSNGWGSNAWTLNYTKTVTLPANTYVLKVAARASEGTTATLKATIGENTITEALPNFSGEGKGITTSGAASFNDGEFAKDGKGYGWQWRYLAFTLDTESEVTLQIDASANSVNQWCSFGDVAVVSNVSTDALETAYNNFTMPTLGFENGQYAPYNNVAVLEAYAEAKAIVEGTKEPSTQPAVDALTATLTNPTWTANTADVDAIYNGNFSSSEDWGLTGWTRTNAWGQQRDDLEGSITTAYYNQAGSLQYGNAGIYTMPLKENTIYRLQFKYGAWDQDVTPTISVLNGENGMAAMSFTSTSTNYKTSMIDVDMVFVTGAAGNYILTIAGDKNLVVTGVSITKAASQILEFADGIVPAYAPGTYPTVKITRTLTANRWATAVYPFAVSGVDNIAVLSSYDKATGALGFTTATASTANEPFLMRSTAGATEISLSNVEVAAAAATDATASEASLKGVYAETVIDNSAKNYVLSNNTIYPIGTNNASIPAYRAYIQVAQDAAARALTFFVDGETTAIEGISTDNSENGNVYNLNGQRVEKAQKGLYIMNGRKVVVK